MVQVFHGVGKGWRIKDFGIINSFRQVYHSDRFQKLLHPYSDKQEETMSRIKELKELSVIATEAGMPGMYQSLNREANELLMQYLVYAFFDGIRFLLPHVVAIWLLSIKFSIINLPLSLPGIGNQIGIIAWYPLCVIGYYIGKKYMKKKRAAADRA